MPNEVLWRLIIMPVLAILLWLVGWLILRLLPAFAVLLAVGWPGALLFLAIAACGIGLIIGSVLVWSGLLAANYHWIKRPDMALVFTGAPAQFWGWLIGERWPFWRP